MGGCHSVEGSVRNPVVEGPGVVHDTHRIGGGTAVEGHRGIPVNCLVGTRLSGGGGRLPSHEKGIGDVLDHPPDLDEVPVCIRERAPGLHLRRGLSLPPGTGIPPRGLHIPETSGDRPALVISHETSKGRSPGDIPRGIAGGDQADVQSHETPGRPFPPDPPRGIAVRHPAVATPRKDLSGVRSHEPAHGIRSGHIPGCPGAGYRTILVGPHETTHRAGPGDVPGGGTSHYPPHVPSYEPAHGPVAGDVPGHGGMVHPTAGTVSHQSPHIGVPGDVDIQQTDVPY